MPPCMLPCAHDHPCCKSRGEIDEPATSEEESKEYEPSDLADVMLWFLTARVGTVAVPGGGSSTTDRKGGSCGAGPNC